jgi:hypothetical protein
MQFDPSGTSIDSNSSAKAPEVLMEFYGDTAGQPSLDWLELRSQY